MCLNIVNRFDGSDNGPKRNQSNRYRCDVIIVIFIFFLFATRQLGCSGCHMYAGFNNL